MKPVMLPPGFDRLPTNPLPMGSDTNRKYDRDCLGLPLQCGGSGRGYGNQQIGIECDQLFREKLQPLDVAGSSCARAESGHATVTPPSAEMNCRLPMPIAI